MQVAIPGVGVVNYDEKFPGSPQYRFSSGMSQATRTFTCDWGSRRDLIPFLLGYPKIVNADLPDGTKYTYISRVLPDEIPDFLVPGKDEAWLFASQVMSCMGKGETGKYDVFGMADYQDCEFTLIYEPRTFKILEDQQTFNPTVGLPDESLLVRYITRVQKPSAEFIQLPRGTMAWVDGARDSNGKPTRVDYASARLVPSTEITYTWHEVPFIPQAAGQFVGCLNRYPFTDNSLLDPDGKPTTFPAGTLLLLAAEMKPYRNAAGVFVQDISYRMKYLDPDTPTVSGRGHNYFLRLDPRMGTLTREKMTDTGTNDWVAIIPDGDTNSPYNPATQPGVVNGVTYVAVNLGASTTSKGVYGYAGFTSLFRFKIQDTDAVVGR